MPSTMLPLCVYLKHCFGQCTGISFIDATSLKVCHNRRIASHRVFNKLAARGKTSVDWFFGFIAFLGLMRYTRNLNTCKAAPCKAASKLENFVPHKYENCYKLHLVVNEQGELLNLQITPGKIDARKPVPDLLKSLFGQVFGDRGYVCSSLAQKL
jgi:hypothetical protein